MFRKTLATVNPVGVLVRAVPGSFKTEYRICKTDSIEDIISKGREDVRKKLLERGITEEEVDDLICFDRNEELAMATFPGLARLKLILLQNPHEPVYDKFTAARIWPWRLKKLINRIGPDKIVLGVVCS
jgi:hypothetical protein